MFVVVVGAANLALYGLVPLVAVWLIARVVSGVLSRARAFPRRLPVGLPGGVQYISETQRARVHR